MPSLTVPTKLEEYLSLGDGSQGANLRELLSFKHDQVYIEPYTIYDRTLVL